MCETSLPQRPRIASVYSLNYDYVPTIAYGKQCFWADLKWPAPGSIRIGSVIKFASASKDFTPPPSDNIFTVSDIIGSRIVISISVPQESFKTIHYFMEKLDRKPWSPLDHSPHWGYATRDLANPNPAADRNWTYGNGEPICYIVW